MAILLLFLNLHTVVVATVYDTDLYSVHICYTSCYLMGRSKVTYCACALQLEGRGVEVDLITPGKV